MRLHPSTPELLLKYPHKPLPAALKAGLFQRCQDLNRQGCRPLNPTTARLSTDIPVCRGTPTPDARSQPAQSDVDTQGSSPLLGTNQIRGSRWDPLFDWGRAQDVLHGGFDCRWWHPGRCFSIPGCRGTPNSDTKSLPAASLFAGPGSSPLLGTNSA